MKLFLSTLTLCSILFAAPRQLYSLQDLEVLESNNNFREFFAHALDIRPSKRNKAWKNMCINMAESFMADMQEQGITKEDRQLFLKVLKYPALTGDEFFIEKRDYFLALMAKDYAKNHSAEKSIQFSKDIYEKFRGKPVFGIHLAKAIYPIMKKDEYHIKYLDFFKEITEPMISSKFSEFYCAKEPINQLVIDLIFFKTIQTKKIHKDCISKLLPSLEKRLYSNDNNIRQSAFEFLSKNKLIKKSDKAHYHVLNLLYGKQYTKEEWDPIIKSLKIIGDNYQIRSEIMEKIAKMDPYPDVLFDVYPEKQLISLSRIISRYFPEYLDRYTKNCLNYLSGKKTFKNGNPTPNCHKYMRIGIKSESSPPQVLKQYDEIINGWKRN